MDASAGSVSADVEVECGSDCSAEVGECDSSDESGGSSWCAESVSSDSGGGGGASSIASRYAALLRGYRVRVSLYSVVSAC